MSTDSGPPVGPDSDTGSTANSGSEKTYKELWNSNSNLGRALCDIYQLLL